MRLRAPAALLDELTSFYGQLLGLDVERSDASLAVRVGETLLELVGSEGEPFYHVAVLVPGDRGAAAIDWLAERVPLLPDPETGARHFSFESWSARACYVHDPAGTILELISLAGIEERGACGPFSPRELVGLSEVGLVGDTAAMAARLEHDVGLELWDGVVGVPGRLGFVGERGRSLILCPLGRGWLPTGRPAEAHPAEVTLSGVGRAETLLEGGRYRISGGA